MKIRLLKNINDVQTSAQIFCATKK